MAFTKITQDMNIISTLADEPNVDDGLSSAQLKAKFDKAGNDLKTAFNNFVDEITATSGTTNAGASNIGASAIYSGDESVGTVQSKLEHLKTLIDNAVLGEIPDNSLTKAKLNSTYSSLLAEKDNTLQFGLNSEKLGGETLVQVLAHTTYTIGTYTGDGQSEKTISLDFTPQAVIAMKAELTATVRGDFGLAVTNSPSKTADDDIVIEIISGGFKVYYNSGNLHYVNMNKNNAVYNYIAFK